MPRGQTAAVDGEVLGEHVNKAPLDGPVSSNNAIPQCGIGRAVRSSYEHIDLAESLIQQQFDSLAGAQLSFSFLSSNPLFASTQARRGL